MLEREARDRAKEEADEWAAADIVGGDGGPPKPLERFGWPDKPHSSKVINSKDRKAEKIATETHAQSQSTKKIEATQLRSPEMEIKTEPWVAEEEEAGSFAQSITERLAFLEADEEPGGGVKLPAVMERVL